MRLQRVVVSVLLYLTFTAVSVAQSVSSSASASAAHANSAVRRSCDDSNRAGKRDCS